jgi:hypothetical protein
MDGLGNGNVYIRPIATAKLIFSCNRLPGTQDHGLAYFKRWRIIEFPNTFEGEAADQGLGRRIDSRLRHETFKRDGYKCVECYFNPSHRI